MRFGVSEYGKGNGFGLKKNRKSNVEVVFTYLLRSISTTRHETDLPSKLVIVKIKTYTLSRRRMVESNVVERWEV